MANIAKIALGSTTYTLKDSTARTNYTNLANRVTPLETTVATLSGIVNASGSNFLTVSKTGGQFHTINTAIAVARTYCSKTNRVTILIGAGVYNEEVTLNPNPGIDLIGCGIDSTIVEYASAYPNSPLYTIGDGTFKGINFRATKPASGSASYAFHSEAQNVSQTVVAGRIRFYECGFEAAENHGIGCGLGDGQVIEFHSCQFVSQVSGAKPAYLHNYPLANAAYMSAEFYECSFINFGTPSGNAIVIDDAAKLTGHASVRSHLYLTFMGCHTQCKGIQIRLGDSASQVYGYVPSDTSVNPNIHLLYGYGNSLVGMNSDLDELNLVYSASVASWGQVHLLLPAPMSNYDIKKFEVYNTSGVKIGDYAAGTGITYDGSANGSNTIGFYIAPAPSDRIISVILNLTAKKV